MLEIQHITKAFGDKTILKDVSFQLEKGKVFVLIGPNGSGKTTLLNIISGFLKADSGTVLLDNEVIDKLLPHQRNSKGISRTFQDMRLIGELNVLENVLLAFRKQKGEKWRNLLFSNRGVNKEEERNIRKALQILNDCFIYDVAHSKSAEISFGQQKLLNLACCIANGAKVVLMDEPVAGVNLLYREKLEVIINKMKNDRVLLIIEHDPNFIKAVSDKILFLNAGQLTKFENYMTMRNNEAVKEAYI